MSGIRTLFLSVFVLVVRASGIHADGGAFQRILLANAVLKVPQIGEVQKLGVITKQDERWGPGCNLGGVIDLERLSLS